MKTLTRDAGTLVLLASLASCGDDPAETATDSQYAAAGAQGDSQGGSVTTGPPGASGVVADVSGRTMQVQNPAVGQVAVTWTAKTTFTEQIDASLADVAVGDCVMVTSAADPSSDSDFAVSADQVRITAAVDGECTPGGGRGPGGPGQLMTSAPEGAPTDLPSDVPTDGMVRVEGSAGAFGQVTAVSQTGFTVDSVRPAAPGSPDSSTTTSVKVTVTGDTSYTTTAKATSDAVRVGVCVDAQGSEDSTGAVTADTIAVTPKVDGQCGSFGFGGPVVRKAA